MSKSEWPWNEGRAYEIRGIPMKSGAPRCPWFQRQSTDHQGVPDFRGGIKVNMVSLNSGVVTKINRVSLNSGAVLTALSVLLPQRLDCHNTLTAWQLDYLDCLYSLTAWLPEQLNYLDRFTVLIALNVMTVWQKRHYRAIKVVKL